MAINDQIRPLYGELIGYMAQAPNAPYMRDSGLWEHFHGLIDQLNKITANDFSRFRLSIHPDGDSPYVRGNEYRSNLNGLIMNLYSTYFSSENPPFSGSPQTVVNQTQSQNQEVSITMIMEFQSLIDKQLYGNQSLSKEQKTFLEIIKENLPSVKTAVDLVSTIISVAKTLGMNIDQVKNSFGV